MKHVLIIAAVLVVTGIAFWQFTIPKNESVLHREVIYLGDQTEDDFPLVSGDQLLTLSVSSNPTTNQGERFRLTRITELSLNLVKQLSLSNVPSKWFGNEVKRKEEVQHYRKQLSLSLQEVKSGRESRTGSVIFQIVARELQRLHQSEAVNRILVINSDLMELSSLANFYTDQSFRELQHTPDSIIHDFTEVYPLPSDLSGVMVYLVFQPKDQLENKQFDLTSGLYERMLTSRGARVIISANLIADS